MTIIIEQGDLLCNLNKSGNNILDIEILNSASIFSTNHVFSSDKYDFISPEEWPYMKLGLETDPAGVGTWKIDYTKKQKIPDSAMIIKRTNEYLFLKHKKSINSSMLNQLDSLLGRHIRKTKQKYIEKTICYLLVNAEIVPVFYTDLEKTLREPGIIKLDNENYMSKNNIF